MKVKKSKKITHQLRHAPLSTEMDRPVGKLKAPRVNSIKNNKDDDDFIIDDVDIDDVYDQEHHQVQKKVGKILNELDGSDRIRFQQHSLKQQWMNESDSDDANDEVINKSVNDCEMMK